MYKLVDVCVCFLRIERQGNMDKYVIITVYSDLFSVRDQKAIVFALIVCT